MKYGTENGLSAVSPPPYFCPSDGKVRAFASGSVCTGLREHGPISVELLNVLGQPMQQHTIRPRQS